MPFYPALPEYRPSVRPLDRPFSALIGGIGAAQQMKSQAAETALKREAVERAQRERQAVEQFQKTGDVNNLIGVMPPQQALMAKDAHVQQQIQTGLATSQYFDQIKPDLTWETYPKMRADAIQKFPGLGEMMFPPPDSIGSKENFEKWKWEKAQKLAQFKALPQVVAAQARLDAAKITAGSRERAAEISAGARLGAATIGAQSREKVAETKGAGGKAETISQARLRLFREGIESGKYKAGPEGWNQFLRDESAAKSAGGAEGKESTRGGQARVKGIEARTKQTETKTEIDTAKKE